MKILIFGSGGLLGSALQEVLKRSHEVVALPRVDCDITSLEQVDAVLATHKPNIIINAAAYTQVDAAEKDTTEAFAINADAVQNLATCAADHKVVLVHFSTDYIFDGSKQEGYREEDAVHPLNVYGESKARGEDAIRKSGADHFIVRSSWLYGPGGGNFVDTMLRLAEEGKETLTVVSDQEGCPTYTFDLAQAVSDLLTTAEYGTYHLVNSGSTTWFDFAREIFHQLGIPQKIEPINTLQLNRPALRPHYSVLLNTKRPPLRPWQEALGDYLMNKTVIV